MDIHAADALLLYLLNVNSAFSVHCEQTCTVTRVICLCRRLEPSVSHWITSSVQLGLFFMKFVTSSSSYTHSYVHPQIEWGYGERNKALSQKVSIRRRKVQGNFIQYTHALNTKLLHSLFRIFLGWSRLPPEPGKYSRVRFWIESPKLK